MNRGPMTSAQPDAATIICRLFIPGEPVAQGRPRVSVVRGRPRVRDPEKSREYKELVSRIAASVMVGEEPFDGPVRAVITASWPCRKPLKKSVRPAEWRVAKPDGDNIAKSVLDGCNGIVYRDDSQVVDLVVRKRNAAQDEAPGVSVAFESVGVAELEVCPVVAKRRKR